MVDDEFRASEGGVKIVFDLPEPSVVDVSRVLAAAGFTVRRYYPGKLSVGKGGAESGWVRLGAEMPRVLFTDEEEHRIVASFDAVQGNDGFVTTSGLTAPLAGTVARPPDAAAVDDALRRSSPGTATAATTAAATSDTTAATRARRPRAVPATTASARRAHQLPPRFCWQSDATGSELVPRPASASTVTGFTQRSSIGDRPARPSQGSLR